ncbi:MAG: hypothetical protein M5R36_11430 [Deltaproteobacteria bacterium]|nr:hypothetical protein [Deltaproteobacteria bacterium]
MARSDKIYVPLDPSENNLFVETDPWGELQVPSAFVVHGDKSGIPLDPQANNNLVAEIDGGATAQNIYNGTESTDFDLPTKTQINRGIAEKTRAMQLNPRLRVNFTKAEINELINQTGPEFLEHEGKSFTDKLWASKYPTHYVGFCETSFIWIRAKVNGAVRAVLSLSSRRVPFNEVTVPLLFTDSGGIPADYVIWFADNAERNGDVGVGVRGEKINIKDPLQVHVANNVRGDNRVMWTRSDPHYWPNVRVTPKRIETLHPDVPLGSLYEEFEPTQWQVDLYLADRAIWDGHPLDTDIFDRVHLTTDEMSGSALGIYEVNIVLNMKYKLAAANGQFSPLHLDAFPVTKDRPLVLDERIEEYGLGLLGSSYYNPILRYGVQDLAQSWSPKYFPLTIGWDYVDDPRDGIRRWKRARKWWSSDYTTTTVRRSTNIKFPLVGERILAGREFKRIGGHSDVRNYYLIPNGWWISPRVFGSSSKVEYEDLGDVVKPGYYVIGNRNDHSALFVRWTNGFDKNSALNEFRCISGNWADRVSVHDGLVFNPALLPQSGGRAFAAIPPIVYDKYTVWWDVNYDHPRDGFGRLDL